MSQHPSQALFKPRDFVTGQPGQLEEDLVNEVLVGLSGGAESECHSPSAPDSPESVVFSQFKVDLVLGLLV